jgi:hypothetical protein
MPNGHKMFQTIIKYNNIIHSKSLQIGILGLKINHLATLGSTVSFEKYFRRKKVVKRMAKNGEKAEIGNFRTQK